MKHLDSSLTHPSSSATPSARERERERERERRWKWGAMRSIRALHASLAVGKTFR